MHYFHYKDQELYCEDVPLTELAEEFGTPLYVYSKRSIIENLKALQAVLSDTQSVICYAVKANANLHILEALAREGAGADVVSAGELYLALKAGFDPKKIVFAGVGKREDEIECALTRGIHSINVESFQELQTVSRLALRLGTGARVALRINPDIDAESHPYISTGLKHNKFGIEAGRALDAFQYAASLPNLEVVGLHTHIGSQITKPEPFVATAHFVVSLVEQLKTAGIALRHIDFGGGFGVEYINAICHEALGNNGGERVPPPSDILATVLPVLKQTGLPLWIEPGRCIVAEAGALLTRVLYTKENGARRFVVVDAGMNDLLRPSLYNAYHQIVPAKILTYEHEVVDVVGPVCETGDYFARERSLPKFRPNEYLSIMTAGAYGFVTASQYNGRPRPAEILVNGEKVRVIRSRESFADLE